MLVIYYVKVQTAGQGVCERLRNTISMISNIKVFLASSVPIQTLAVRLPPRDSPVRSILYVPWRYPNIECQDSPGVGYLRRSAVPPALVGGEMRA